MNHNPASQTSFSHPNYGENFYVPPSLHHNKYDLDPNSTQTNHIDRDALRAQQLSGEMDQVGMASPSMPQQKQKKIYEVYYHQPGEEFAAPSQSNVQYTEGYVPTFPFPKKDGQENAAASNSSGGYVPFKKEGQENAMTSAQLSGGYVPLFPKKEGQENDYKYSQSSRPYTDYSCNKCGSCSDCRVKRDQEWKKQEDACLCCMKWSLLIVFGICFVMVGGDSADCNGNDCCDEKKPEEPRPQPTFRL